MAQYTLTEDDKATEDSRVAYGIYEDMWRKGYTYDQAMLASQGQAQPDAAPVSAPAPSGINGYLGKLYAPVLDDDSGPPMGVMGQAKRDSAALARNATDYATGQTRAAAFGSMLPSGQHTATPVDDTSPAAALSRGRETFGGIVGGAFGNLTSIPEGMTPYQVAMLNLTAANRSARNAIQGNATAQAASIRQRLINSGLGSSTVEGPMLARVQGQADAAMSRLPGAVSGGFVEGVERPTLRRGRQENLAQFHNETRGMAKEQGLAHQREFAAQTSNPNFMDAHGLNDDTDPDGSVRAKIKRLGELAANPAFTEHVFPMLMDLLKQSVTGAVPQREAMQRRETAAKELQNRQEDAAGIKEQRQKDEKHDLEVRSSNAKLASEAVNVTRQAWQDAQKDVAEQNKGYAGAVELQKSLEHDTPEWKAAQAKNNEWFALRKLAQKRADDSKAAYDTAMTAYGQAMGLESGPGAAAPAGPGNPDPAAGPVSAPLGGGSPTSLDIPQPWPGDPSKATEGQAYTAVHSGQTIIFRMRNGVPVRIQ